jgi:hypothetical protein
VDEVDGDDAAGLGGEELPPGWASAAGRGADPGVMQDLPDRQLYLSQPGSSPPRRIGLDLSVPMFAPCLLGCPGTGRQHPASAARRGCGRPDRMAAPGRC